MSEPYSIKASIFKNIDHTTHISNKLQTFYREKKYFNITLIAGIDNSTAEAHRIVLCASSVYFQTMFDSYLAEAKAVKLENIDGATLRSILDYMYTASIELRTNTIIKIMKTAELLQMSALIDACCDFMEEHLNPSNCLGIAFFAQTRGYIELCSKSFSFAYNHFEEVCTHQEFLCLEEKQLNGFLSGNDLDDFSQEKLFNNLVAWYKYDETKRDRLICNLLSQHIRYELLEPKFIADNRTKLWKIPECCELLWSWLNWHLYSGSFKSRIKKPVLIYLSNDFEDLTVQTFDKELNKWSYEHWPVPLKGKMKYTMFVTNENKFVTSGGIINGEITNTVECLDLQSMKWSELPPMISKRCLHEMTKMNGDLYVVGGHDSTNNYLNSMERYNVSTGKWEKLKPLPSPLTGIQVAVLNGHLYVTGYNQNHLDCYNPATNSWTQTAVKNEKLLSFSLVAVNRYLYAVGGECDSRQKSTTVERYDPLNNSWVVMESLKVGRSGICCTALNGRLLASGGVYDDDDEIHMFEEYNPQINAWNHLAPCLDYHTMRNGYAILSII